MTRINGSRAALVCVTVLIIALGYGAFEARASLVDPPRRRLTGSACAQVGTSGVFRITANDGAVFNDASSGTLTVDCPVPTHGTFDTVQTSELWYLDNSTSAITCTYRVEDKLSTAVNSHTLSSTGDDNLYRSMTFSVQQIRGSHVHIRCTIPPRDASGNASYIVGYAGR